MIDEGGLDDRVGVLLLLVDSARLREPASLDFLATYVNTLELRFPSAIDPTFVTDRYFASGGMPLQMLIDVHTMELRGAVPGNLEEFMPTLEQELSK